MSGDLRALARQLGGEVSGGQALCPGPGHGPKDRSLAVRPNGPDDFLIHSFAGDDPIVCLAHVRSKLGIARPERSPPSRPKPGGDDDRERRQHEKARWLWGQRRPLAGTIAERYLREARGYGGPLPASLGFLKAQKDYPPALIAAFAMPEESEPGVLATPRAVGSVLLISLRADGSGKAEIEDPKRIVGSPCGLPVVVAPVNDLLGLAICEGVEDALSVYEATGLGVWAAGGAGFMPKLAAAVPSYVEAVTIFAHADETGRRGASDLARSLADTGVSLSITEASDG